MKKLLLLSLVLFYTSFSFGQACLSDGLIITTQEEVDNFAINYPGCTIILGSLSIHGNGSLTNLNGLSQITNIQGNLEIFGTVDLINLNGLNNLNSVQGNILFHDLQLNDFTGLENLTSIFGDLRIEMSQFDNFSGLSNLTSIFNGDFHLHLCSFTDFEGLEALTTIGGDLFVEQSSFENFMGLDNLTQIQGGFEFLGNQFTNFAGLSNLTSIGININIGMCNFNNFCGLEGLTAINGMFEIMNSQINSFIGFDNLNTINGSFFIMDSEIKSFHGFESLTSISGGFNLSNIFQLKDFSGLENLTTITEYLYLFECNDLVNFTGLENLTAIQNHLNVFGCSSLISFTGLEQLEIINGPLQINDNNALLSISEFESLNPNALWNVNINNNPSLSICGSSAICTFLEIIQGQGGATISNNAPGCNEAVEILLNCTSDLSKVSYYLFYDLNQNQVLDANEPLYSDASIEVNPLAYYSYNHSDHGGTIYLEPGDYNLNLITNSLWDLTTDSSAFELTVSEPNSCDTVYFGLFPNQAKSLLISTIQAPPARCNEWVVFDVAAKNLGTTTATGILWFEIDENILDVDFIDVPDTIVEPHLYGWFYSNLYPSQSLTKQMNLKIPGPPNFPVGDFLHFKSYLEFNGVIGPQTSTEFLYDTEVRCSFDPNDKLVHPNREGNYTLFEEQIIYTIRFQNTGNDFAYDVTIQDTLDANLNAETFRVLGTSHPNQLATTLQDGQFLTFSFENIFLPDSTADFDGSQGYVSYLIEGNENLPEETNISNTASIYFDSNPPVVTNTTENLMVSELPTTAIDPAAEQLKFAVFPNPTNGNIQVVGEQIQDAMIQVRDYNGRLVLETPFQFQQTVNLGDFPSGVYSIQVKTEKATLSQKVIKF